jgi:fumarate reductase flavoprotein subunit
MEPTQEGHFTQQWSFETPPAPIPETQIKEVITADVVVAGAGLAGLCAALAAAQSGAKVSLIEKGARSMFHGARNAAVGSRLQKKLGFEIDKEEFVAEMMRWSAYQADQRLLKLWVDESGPAMDWILDMLDAADVAVTIEPVTRQGDFYKHYPTSHLIPRRDPTKLTPGNAELVRVLEDNARAAGVDVRFRTPAVQLLRARSETGPSAQSETGPSAQSETGPSAQSETGPSARSETGPSAQSETGPSAPVIGIIAKTQAGFVQFDARAVVLCTGGYEHDPEMLRRYIPRALDIASNWYLPPLTTGDGHKMGLWIGAAMDEAIHCPVLFDGSFPGKLIPLALVRQPFLNVNLLGERYMNEDAPFGYIANADLLQPGHTKWTVWDDKWAEEAPGFGGIICKKMVPPVHTPELVQGAIDKGLIIQADTLDELAQKMQVPAETFLATVERYNELARLSKDLDFGKHPSRLTTIEKPPFSAARTGAALLATLNGLKVNTRLQVLDTAGHVVPGLYAAGNASGGFFANDYPIVMPGLSHGRALTFGRLAGLNAAAET